MSPPTPTDQSRVCREEEKAQSGILGVTPVADHDHLVRIVLRPLHLRNDGLDECFLNISHLERGWSFIRRKIAGEEKIQAHGRKQADRKPNQEMYGYAVIKTADFRAILDDENRQAFCILDDEREDAPAHAIAKKSAHRIKHKNRKLRKKVLDLLEQQLIVL